MTTATCETEIPARVAPAMVDVGTVASALTHPDVTALLDRHTTVLVGSDSRPVDGTVFAIRRGTDTLFVGGSCRDGTTGCVPAPAGLARGGHPHRPHRPGTRPARDRTRDVKGWRLTPSAA